MALKSKYKQREPKLAARCKKDFRHFLYIVWKHLALPDPTPVQYDVAHFLQNGPKRMIIEGFRGVGKSWVTSAFVCWLLLRNPQEKILVVSASKQRSDDFSTFTLRLIKEIPILQHLTPLPDQRESKIAFDVAPADAAHAPSVKSAGIFGQITGSRATIIVADDIEVANNSATTDMREKLVTAVAEFEAILVPEGKPRIIFLGTPQTEESIYNKLRGKGYTCRIWPARFPNKKQIEGYKGALAPMLEKRLVGGDVVQGEPCDPQRFGMQDLAEREASYGRSGFSLQFMLDTSLADAEKYPLKTGDLMIMDLNAHKAPPIIQYGSGPEQRIHHEFAQVGFAGDYWYRPMYFDKNNWTKYEGVVMAIDPSGRGGDETGYAVVAQLHGKLYCLAAGGIRGGYEGPVLRKLAEIAKEWGVRKIIIESNFGDGMYTALIKPVLGKIYPCTCEEVRHSIQKEKRIIDTLEPLMNQHRLVVNAQIVRDDLEYLDKTDEIERNQVYSLFYQMTRLTKERGALKHDDRLDALAIAVNYWVESMARDSDKAKKAHDQRLLDKELRIHMENLVVGGVKTSTGFINTGFN